MSLRRMKVYEAEQEADVMWREEFLGLTLATQGKIISLLENMFSKIQRKSSVEAQKYFFAEIRKHRDENYRFKKTKIWGGVEWEHVYDQIMHSCFSNNDDMSGPTLVERRVESQLTTFRALRDLSQSPIDY